jgi:RimJ/RimL family protein N-acetyltransferase
MADAAPAFTAMYRNRAILDWLAWAGPDSSADFEIRFAHWRAAGSDANDYFFAIDDVASNAFAGALTLRFTGHPRRGRIGYWIRQDLWNRGLATEAIQLVAWLAFEKLDATELFAGVFVGNASSRRALEKNGFTLVDRDLLPLLPGTADREQWPMQLLRADAMRTLESWRPSRAEVGFSASGSR